MTVAIRSLQSSLALFLAVVRFYNTNLGILNESQQFQQVKQFLVLIRDGYFLLILSLNLSIKLALLSKFSPTISNIIYIKNGIFKKPNIIYPASVI